jgi:hypothetical protein
MKLDTHTHIHIQQVGLPLTSDQLFTEAATFTTHNKHNRPISMPLEGFELAIPAIKRTQNYAVTCTATGRGKLWVTNCSTSIRNVCECIYIFFYCSENLASTYRVTNCSNNQFTTVTFCLFMKVRVKHVKSSAAKITYNIKKHCSCWVRFKIEGV